MIVIRALWLPFGKSSGNDLARRRVPQQHITRNRTVQLKGPIKYLPKFNMPIVLISLSLLGMMPYL